MPAGNPEPVRLEHLGELDQRLDVGRLDLGDPATQVLLGGVGIVDLVEVVELECVLVAAGGHQRLLEELIQPVLLLGGQLGGPLEPQIPRVLQQARLLLGLRSADLVDRLGQVLAHVVAIERDLRRRQVLERPGQIRLRHVLAHLADPLDLAAVGLKKAGELLHGALIAALGHVHRAALVQVGEHRHVVLPALGAGLIDPGPLNTREVLRLDRLIDVVVHDPPDALVFLADQRRDRRDRHLLDQRHHQRLEQQREPRALPRPRHLHLLDRVLRADHPRNPRRQVRLVLEEVQMPPGLLLGVMHLAACRSTLRTPEPRALREVDAQIQPPPLHVKLDIHYLPRLLKTKRSGKQVEIVHAGSHDRGSEARQTPSHTGRYPLKTPRGRRVSARRVAGVAGF